MNNPTEIAIAITATVTALTAVGYAIAIAGAEAAICEKFPHIDPKDVKTAHKELRKAAMRGELTDAQINDDAQMEALFLSYLNN